MDWKSQLDRAVDNCVSDVVALRHHLHAHPEPSGEELQTSLHLYQLLGKLELEVRMGPDGCGVVAENDFQNGDIAESPDTARVALRGDIDALRIQDEKEVSYASTNQGIMHACGHDAHTAIIYGVAATLASLERSGSLPWPVAWRAIFQPSEETATGAAQMIEAGVLENVSAIFALHVDPTRRTGEIGMRSGPLTAHCDSLHLTVHGQGGHGARPHESRDPIAASAQLINALYQFVPRASDSFEAVVVSIGQLRGGENPNVIPDTVELWGTVRTLDASVRSHTIEKIRQVARGVGEITSTEIEVAFHVSIPSVYNDADMTRLVWQEAEDVVGRDNVQLIARPSMGSEDFACYLENIPGTMFRLGCASDLAAAKALHTSMFDIDENALVIGVRILARAAILACRPDNGQSA